MGTETRGRKLKWFLFCPELGVEKAEEVWAETAHNAAVLWAKDYDGNFWGSKEIAEKRPFVLVEIWRPGEDEYYKRFKVKGIIQYKYTALPVGDGEWTREKLTLNSPG